MEVEVYSGKVEAWNQLRFWIVVGLQYSRLPVTRTLYNSNLPLTRSNFHSLQNIFCTILSSITWIFFYFPWRFELSGVDCTCKFVSYFFWLIDTKWSKFTILSHQWISRLRLELMHCTSYKFAFRNMNWYANFKTPMSRNSSNVTLNREFQTYIGDQKV